MKRHSESSSASTELDADHQERRLRFERMIQSGLDAMIGSRPSDEESFYDLGLNSIQFTQLGSRLAANSGLPLPSALTMKYASVAQLADYLTETASEPPTSFPCCSSSSSPSPDACFPQLYNQQECYAWHEHVANKAFLHLCLPIRMRSPVDARAMQESLQALVERHATLRTAYFKQDGQSVQRVQEARSLLLERIDVPEPSWQAAAFRIRQAAVRPFDLEHDPLLRAHLFSRGSDDHLLLFVTHHIAVDATAFSILLNEFFSWYEARCAGREPTLPKIDGTFADFVHWQTAMLQGPEGERLRHYWHQQLAGDLPDIDLPTDHPRHGPSSHDGACHFFRLESRLVSELRALAREQRGTLYMVLLAAFQWLLHRHSGQNDIIVATHTQNREKPELVNLVGYLSDTV
ncbi:MAG: hypothetical protein HQM00_06455, partial [Magnetococcales bacterium]|nr:hypothetical protein [Magnetococcales bacterium]